MIVNNKIGLKSKTFFDFKYIPRLNKRTVMKSGTPFRSDQCGVERRNLRAVVLAALVAVALLCILILSARWGLEMVTLTLANLKPRA